MVGRSGALEGRPGEKRPPDLPGVLFQGKLIQRQSPAQVRRRQNPAPEKVPPLLGGPQEISGLAQISGLDQIR